ncbi:MAG TPA: hypothetical protein VMU34_04650, partial [Mycobacterium sp.]|nr:hypothetical protein [Mycobacterium sp.]
MKQHFLHRVSSYTAAGVLGAALLVGCASSDASGSGGPDCAGPGFSEQALVLVVSVHQGASAPSVPVAAACDIESALRSARPISVV